MDLIGHHVLQPLVENGSAEDVAIEILSCCSRDEGVLASVRKTIIGEYLAEIFSLVSRKGSTRMESSFEAPCLAADKFEQLSNSHAGGIAMRIHDEVWPPASL